MPRRQNTKTSVVSSPNSRTSVRTANSTLEHLQWMAFARVLDRALCDQSSRWFPAEGEEAVIVGSFCDLGASDVAAPHYRDPFIVYLMRGAELWRLVAQVLGKPAGYNKGRSVPFTGPFDLNIVPWVAGDLGTSLGIATGAALALQQIGTNGVVVCTFGDGTANRGDFHENVNLAAVWQLPIVFVCQNNGWAISQPAKTYLAADIVDRAGGYGIPGLAVDGQDIDAVRAAVRAGIKRARKGAGPTLVEARTIRMRGHWSGDTADYRGGAAIQTASDPLDVLAQRLIKNRDATEATLALALDHYRGIVSAAIDRARLLPDPTRDDLGLNEVYV